MLLALVALFFAIGHAHQVFERFEAHTHSGAAHPHDHDPSEDSDHEDPVNGNDHSAWHHLVTAVIDVAQEPLITRLEMLSMVESVAVLPPDAPVLGIEHPPQIALG